MSKGNGNGPGIPRITAWIGLVLSALVIAVAVTALTGCQVQGACHGHGGLKTVINGIQYCNDGTEV